MKKVSKQTLLRILLSVLGLSIVFLSGSMHEDTYFERIAEYSSKVVKTKTIDKRYCAISFDAPNKTGKYYSDELTNLFDIFRSGVVSYASGMNVHKEISIKIPDYSDNNLSLVFVGAIGSINVKDDKGHVIGWRHNKYNFDTMFEDPLYNETEYDKKNAPVVYLSQKQADRILESKNIYKEDGAYSTEQYGSLLKTEIKLRIENDYCSYYIWNIFYNRGFYCEGLADILGDFALTSYYQPKNHDLRQIHKSLYFFNEYSYYNQYLMRYLNSRFSDEKILPSLVEYNLKGDVNNEFLLSFFHNKSISSRHWLYSSLLILATCIILASLFILFKNEKDNPLLIVLTFASLFFPYCIFKFIFISTNDVLFFSQPVCKTYVLFVVIYIFVYLFRLFGIKQKTINNERLTRYEIDI